MLQGTYALEDIDSQGIERIYAQTLPSWARSGCTFLGWRWTTNNLLTLCVCVSVCVCACVHVHRCARVCSPAHACTRVCDFAAGTNEAEGDGEAGGVGDVTKQLEQQTLEDKEREEDGEEGNSSPSPPSSSSSSSSAVGIVLNFKPPWKCIVKFSRSHLQRDIWFSVACWELCPGFLSIFLTFSQTVLKLMMLSTDGDEGENSAGKKKKKKKKKKGCKPFFS